MDKNRIREVRKKRGLTLAQLAASCSVDKSTVQRWEQGAMPSGGSLLRLVKALGCGPSELFPNDVTGAA